MCVRDRESVKERGLEGCSKTRGKRIRKVFLKRKRLCVCERQREREGERIGRML